MTNEPEDVTIGFVTGVNILKNRSFFIFFSGVVLGLELNQTGLIHSHGNDLYGVNPALLKYQASRVCVCVRVYVCELLTMFILYIHIVPNEFQFRLCYIHYLHTQIGISYGFGSVQWGFKPHNVVVVPQRLFSIEEDASQYVIPPFLHMPILSYTHSPTCPFSIPISIPYIHSLIHPFSIPSTSIPPYTHSFIHPFSHTPILSIPSYAHSTFLHTPILHSFIHPFPILHTLIPPHAHSTFLHMPIPHSSQSFYILSYTHSTFLHTPIPHSSHTHSPTRPFYIPSYANSPFFTIILHSFIHPFYIPSYAHSPFFTHSFPHTPILHSFICQFPILHNHSTFFHTPILHSFIRPFPILHTLILHSFICQFPILHNHSTFFHTPILHSFIRQFPILHTFIPPHAHSPFYIPSCQFPILHTFIPHSTFLHTPIPGFSPCTATITRPSAGVSTDRACSEENTNYLRPHSNELFMVSTTTNVGLHSNQSHHISIMQATF